MLKLIYSSTWSHVLFRYARPDCVRLTERWALPERHSSPRAVSVDGSGGGKEEARWLIRRSRSLAAYETATIKQPAPASPLARQTSHCLGSVQLYASGLLCPSITQRVLRDKTVFKFFAFLNLRNHLLLIAQGSEVCLSELKLHK
jgi:hypothetical protein